MGLKSLEFVRVGLSDGIAEVLISRVKALNALNVAVLEELNSVLRELAGYDSLRVLILAGDGDKAFVAGADIAEMADLDPEGAARFALLGQEVTRALETFPVPVLAAVNGYALGGGCELALACDVIYASENAKLGQPEVKLGLIPGFGGTVRLPRRVGLAAACEWIFTGEVYTAQQAQAIGLVHQVHPADELMPSVRRVAENIARRAPLAVRAAKRAIARGMRTDPGSASSIEREQFAALFATEDMREGTRAFVEKREPQFRGA